MDYGHNYIDILMQSYCSFQISHTIKSPSTYSKHPLRHGLALNLLASCNKLHFKTAKNQNNFPLYFKKSAILNLLIIQYQLLRGFQ